MSPMTVMPRQSSEWTVDNLDSLPDDGLQYELLDGVLVVTPAPTPLHQRAVGRMFLLLTAACPPDLEVFVALLDWQPDSRTSLQPDLLVVAKNKIDQKRITRNLALAVEVLSPATRRKDIVLKRSKYEDVGVPSYWVVDPETPSFVAYELVGGHYVEVVYVDGDTAGEVSSPFPARVVPAELV